MNREDMVMLLKAVTELSDLNDRLRRWIIKGEGLDDEKYYNLLNISDIIVRNASVPNDRAYEIIYDDDLDIEEKYKMLMEV